MTKTLEGLLDHAQEWADRAEAFIIKNGWSLTDENRKSLIQTTATYLMHVDKLGIPVVRKSCYVLHNQDSDFRYQSFDRSDVYKRWKHMVGHGGRAAFFYWDGEGNCHRLHAHEDYTLSRDY